MRFVGRTPMWQVFGIWLLSGVLLSGFGSQPVFADQFPSHPIKIYVGFTAGGPTDIPVRYVANKLSAAIGQPVIVENKPGAASMLAIREMLSHPRDGYSLLSCTYFDPVNTLLYSHPGYKFSDIAPVTMMARYDYGVVVPPNSAIKNVSDLLKFAKANPGKLNYGHLGVGSTQNLIAKQLKVRRISALLEFLIRERPTPFRTLWPIGWICSSALPLWSCRRSRPTGSA